MIAVVIMIEVVTAAVVGIEVATVTVVATRTTGVVVSKTTEEEATMIDLIAVVVTPVVVTMIGEDTVTAVATRGGAAMTTGVGVDIVTTATGEATRVAQEDPHQSKFHTVFL